MFSAPRTWLAAALVSLCLIGLAASPALAVRIGFDDRNYQEVNDLLASGSDFDELRALVTGLGHTIVPVSSFDAASLATADIQALYLSQPFTQSGGGYSGSEISAIQSFVLGGKGLVLHADAGFGAELASLDTLASAFGVSFAATGSEPSGHEILSFVAHPVTAGLGPLPGTGFCVDFQRVLTIGAPATDLTTFGAPLVPEDDAIAAVTGTGGAGNVVLLSDTSGFKDVGVSFDVDIECGANRVLAENIVNFVATPIPEPGSFALLGFGLLGLGARRSRRGRLAR